MRDRKEGVRKMIFPTIRNVELLGCSQSVREVEEFAAARKIPVVTPSIISKDGEPTVTIPDDLGYPVTEEPVATAFRF